jgi:hypothetical protein
MSGVVCDDGEYRNAEVWEEGFHCMDRGEGVILDRHFLFNYFSSYLLFFSLYFLHELIVKYSLVYLPYFSIYFSVWKLRSLRFLKVTIFTKSIFCTFDENSGVKLDRLYMRLDSASYPRRIFPSCYALC